MAKKKKTKRTNYDKIIIIKYFLKCKNSYKLLKN